MKIKVNGTELFFDVYGSQLNILPNKVIQKPTLIVLHGGHGFADHTLYVEFWSRFADRAQVIFLDQRGCGRSDPASAESWDLDHWADDLHAFCQALAIEKPIIAGVSMGGHVMCAYADKYPQAPGGLIFCNTEATFDLDQVTQILKDRGADDAAQACDTFYTNPTLENMQQYTQLCIPHYAHNHYSKEELSRCIKHPDVFIHFCQNEMLQFNFLHAMEKIQCPTLLMIGADSPFHFPQAAQDMAASIKANLVTMALIEKAGAAVYKDQPEESYQIVGTFLSSLTTVKDD
jgi:proline iminopeptidase